MPEGIPDHYSIIMDLDHRTAIVTL